MKKMNIFANRRFKYGTMATVLTILFIVGVVIVNIIFSLVLERFPTSVDLTDEKIYQLTEESVEFAKGIDEKVEIIVCKDESELSQSTYSSQPYGKQAVEIINSYAKYNSNVSVEYVDLVKNPEITQEYSEYAIADYSVIVKSGKRVKVVSVNDFIETQVNSQTQQQTLWSAAEKIMTSALMYVTDDKVTKVSVLTGHSESSVDGFSAMLEDNNYEIAQQNITTEEISEDTNMVVLYAPTTDYSEEELAKLDAFLDNQGKFGKNLIYIASINQPDLPNLEAFLAEWGISVGDSYIMETDASNIYDDLGIRFRADFNTETDVDYTADLRQADLPFMAYGNRPLSLEFETNGNRTAQFLITSPDSTVAVPLDSEQLKTFDPDKAEKQSYGIAALGERTKYDGTTPLISSVLVFGSADMFNTALTTNSTYNNNEYTINVVNKLNGKEESLNITSVSFDAEQLEVTQAQYNLTVIIFVILIPLATIIAAIVVWIRRRNK